VVLFLLILISAKGGEKDENLQNSLDSCFDSNDVYRLDGGFQVSLVECGRQRLDGEGGKKDENLQDSLDSCFDSFNVNCPDCRLKIPLVAA
jgi:hypothetical protein